jgi:phosphate transport system permease protein
MGRRRRYVTDRLFWGLCALAFVLIATPSISILVSLVHQALPALGVDTFTKTTGVLGKDGQPVGGLQNAILGTLLLLLGVLILAGSIGVAAGIYLAEHATGVVERVLRFFSEVLAGIPSIVIGYIGYVALVFTLHWGYSLAAAVVALSALVVPYIIKSTSLALKQLPTHIREGAAGLGMTSSSTLGRILLPAALPAIVSGLVVALAISTGELAPLLFTANFSDQNPTLHLFHHSVPYLTAVIYNDLAQPGKMYHATAAAAGVVTVGILLILIFLGRLLGRRARRLTAQMTV